MRRHLVPISLFTLLTLVITWQLWTTRAVPNTHDGIYHAVRISELLANLQTGQFPVRWAAGLDNGYGIPLFTYVYPLPYYLAVPLSALGVSPFWIVKILTIGFLWLGGLGIYCLSPQQRLRSLVAATIYITAPYQLLNVFVRGALGETLALGLIPWVMVIGRRLTSRSLQWYDPIPMALLLLSHAFLGYLWLPIYLILTWTRKSWVKQIVLILFAFGLSAWYIIPAITKAGWVVSGATGDYTFAYRDHFVSLLQLLTGPWGYGFSVKGSGDGISFQLGYVIWTLGLILAMTQKVRLKYLLVIGGSLFLMLEPSLKIWEMVAPLALMQFPWRFLVVPLAVTVYWFQVSDAKTPLLRDNGLLVALGIGAMLFALTHNQPRYPQSEVQYMAEWYANRTGTTTSARSELLPKWVNEHVPKDTTALPVNYFPGLHAYTPTGVECPLVPNPAGQAECPNPSLTASGLTVRYEETSLDLLADWLTLITTLGLVGIGIYTWRKN
jgi:hypothetical protein